MKVKTTFRNQQEFITYLQEVRPTIVKTRQLAKQRNEGRIVAKCDNVLRLFENDSALLREAYNKIQKPDGTLEMGFSQDAWALLAKAMEA